MSTMYVNQIAPLQGDTISVEGTLLNAQRPAFLAGRTDGNYASTVGKFQLNATKYNIGNVWSTTNYEFTAPVAGMYVFMDKFIIILVLDLLEFKYAKMIIKI